MEYSSKILLDSDSSVGARIVTFLITYPRMVHAELMTHRVFSRNSASSRAIPIQKMISQVWNSPVYPVWWGKNMAGMQSKEELKGFRLFLTRKLWKLLSKFACISAWLLFKVGMHKQIANRVLEPFSWITVIVTATEWDNFFALRCHPDAQPEIKAIAEMMYSDYTCNKSLRPGGGLQYFDIDTRQQTNKKYYQVLKVGEWHLPLLPDKEELIKEGYRLQDLIKISIGRVARVSYLTHDGKRDPKKDLELYSKLVSSGHMSPTEHVAQASNSKTKRSGNFVGFNMYRKTILNEDNYAKVIQNGNQTP
jgi:hypothetical protein